MTRQEAYLKMAIFNGSAWYGHGPFAIKLIETLKPNVTVELGVEYGFSSFCFAYPRIGKVYGVDWFKGDGNSGIKDPEIVKRSLFDLHNRLEQQFGKSNIKFIESDFNDLAKKWDTTIDILHIDGLHTYDAVKNDYETWIKFCHPESVILFHDTESFKDDVGRFFNELNGYKYNRPNSAGLGILTQSKRVFDTISQFINE